MTLFPIIEKIISKIAKDIGEKFILSDRTVDRFLRTPLFEDLGHGKWRKVNQEEKKVA